ncbi:MAG: hypothetical protein ABIW32_00705 [Terrimesophilobacter sp.]
MPLTLLRRSGRVSLVATLAVGAVVAPSGCSMAAVNAGQPGATSSPTVESNPTNAALASETQTKLEAMVAEMKAGAVLPSRVDAQTTVTDVVAEPNAVHYFYTVNDTDPTTLSPAALKKAFTPFVCESPESWPVLNLGANVLLSYYFEGTDVTYDVTITMADCPK